MDDLKKKRSLLIVLTLFLFSCSANSDDQPEKKEMQQLLPGEIALKMFKDNQKVKSFLANKTKENYEVSYGQQKLGGICGFVGCEWRELVSLVVTSKSSNSPSITFLAVVEGQQPDRGNLPTIRFVDLKDMDKDKWDSKL